MTDENAKGYEGAGYVIAYGSAAILSYYLMNLSTFRIYCLIAKLKGAIPCLIYKKVLNISNMVISQGNARGKLANVIASEVEFFDGLVTMVFLLSAPTFLVAAFFILGFLIGPAGIIGLLIIIFHFPIIIGLGKISGKFRMRTAMFADSRVKMITNLVEGIRIVKLYGWENPYLGLIFNKRLIEINEAHKKQRIMSTNRMLGNGSVGLMLFVTFVVYVYLGNEMEPGVVFAAVTILVVTNNLVCWVGAAAIIQLFMLAASMNRITEALTMKKKGVPDYERCKKHSLNVKNASFSWSDQYFNQITKNDNQESNQKLVQPISETSNALVLNDVNFRLRPGELLVVIGPVGCGKSSLFMGLLKEIAITSGKIGINGKFAYAGEDP